MGYNILVFIFSYIVKYRIFHIFSTYRGQCLKLNPNDFPSFHIKETLIVSMEIGHDHSFGWSGTEIGYTFFANVDDYPNAVLDADGIDISSKMVAKARYMKIHRKYLGKPYTNCKGPSHGKPEHKINDHYSEYRCLEQGIGKFIV